MFTTGLVYGALALEAILVKSLECRFLMIFQHLTEVHVLITYTKIMRIARKYGESNLVPIRSYSLAD